MLYHYRCTRRRRGCQGRKTLKKPIEQYVRVPTCPNCKGPLYFDKRRKEETQKNKCQCDGYPYPHKRGSKFCKDSTRDLEWEQMNEEIGATEIVSTDDEVPF